MATDLTAFPQDLLNRLEKSRVVAGFSVDDAADAVPIAEALLAGGIDAIELTLRTDAGIEAVRRIAASVSEILLGVGTILRPDLPAATDQSSFTAGQPCESSIGNGVNG